MILGGERGEREAGVKKSEEEGGRREPSPCSEHLGLYFGSAACEVQPDLLRGIWEQ